jgi:hypothetical protein
VSPETQQAALELRIRRENLEERLRTIAQTLWKMRVEEEWISAELESAWLEVDFCANIISARRNRDAVELRIQKREEFDRARAEFFARKYQERRKGKENPALPEPVRPLRVPSGERNIP